MDKALCEPIYKPLDMKMLREKESVFVSTKEALKDVEPIKWDDDVLEGRREVLLTSKR